MAENVRGDEVIKVCLDCGNRDIRYDEKEKSYHCNNCESRNLGSITYSFRKGNRVRKFIGDDYRDGTVIKGTNDGSDIPVYVKWDDSDVVDMNVKATEIVKLKG